VDETAGKTGMHMRQRAAQTSEHDPIAQVGCRSARPNAARAAIEAMDSAHAGAIVRVPISPATHARLAVATASLFLAQGALGDQPTGSAPPATSAQQSAAVRPTHYQPDRFAGRAGTHYRVVWGVDSLGVKWTESGEVIRFSYRVLDAGKAAPLNEKRFEPSLIDPKAGVSLVVPSMEKIGQLRQSSTPEAGKSYWMAFSNKGRLVKRGDHVSVVIGTFRADGLVVD
jgi:hypothetical protein